MGHYIEQRNRCLQPALEMYRQGYSYARISRILSVSKETIRKWCIKFATGTSTINQMKNIMAASEPAQEKEKDADYKALEQRIKELEAQLEKESIRADFYDEMINVAEAKFNIPIRKKTGTKQ